MCYPCGSVDSTVKHCPMCKVFPHSKCPHRREICRNRSVHPRFDVLFLKNAEVESFNGCGWCKWAGFLQQKEPVNNNGWPGCCRPPQPSEFKMISAVDWKAVNTVFNVPIPPEVKLVLDSIAAAAPASRRATPPPKSSSPKSHSPTSANPGTTTPLRPASSGRANSFTREKTSVAVAIPTKGSKGSPKQNSSALGSVRSTAGSASSSSPKSPSTLEAHHGHRNRQPIPDFGESAAKERKSEGTKSSQCSPSNVSKNLEGEIAAPSPRRVTSIRRNSAASSNVSVPTRSGDKAQDSTVRRRSPMSSSSPASRPSALSGTSGRASDQPQSLPINQVSSRTPRLKEDDSRSSSGSSDGPSSGSGSLSDSTVTSDGGFTDYLSDESEAELQRQAEARAALMAQNQMEEQEFKAARQRLAHVDLRPPRTWNPTNITNTGSVRVAGGPKV